MENDKLDKPVARPVMGERGREREKEKKKWPLVEKRQDNTTDLATIKKNKGILQQKINQI